MGKPKKGEGAKKIEWDEPNEQKKIILRNTTCVVNAFDASYTKRVSSYQHHCCGGNHANIAPSGHVYSS